MLQGIDIHEPQPPVAALLPKGVDVMRWNTKLLHNRTVHDFMSPMHVSASLCHTPERHFGDICVVSGTFAFDRFNIRDRCVVSVFCSFAISYVEFSLIDDSGCVEATAPRLDR